MSDSPIAHVADTAFWVASDKTDHFTACYQPETRGGGLKLQDDARESTYANPPQLESGGGGMRCAVAIPSIAAHKTVNG